MVTVSIIIVNFRTPELIIECLGSIEKFTKIDHEIIIVDNGSKADDENLIKTKFPSIHWLSMNYNAGFARANNAGMKIASGKYLLLLNSDTKLFEDAIDRCVANLENRTDVIAGGAYQVYPDLNPRKFYHTFTFRRDFWIVPPMYRKYLDYIIRPTKYNDPEQVDYISAAFLMVRKVDFEKTGGFDEEFFLYAEDAEWANRLSKLGKLLVFKNCKIIHYEWGSKPERHVETHSYTYFNRFDWQIQLSNIVWLRKQYGAFYFVMLMLHYWLWIPIFFLIRIVLNILNLKNPLKELENQKKFARMISCFTDYFWRILFKRVTFYKLKSKYLKN